MNSVLPVINPCAGCGECCMHCGHPMFLRYGDFVEDAYVNLPQSLRREFDEYIAALEPTTDDPDPDDGQPCYWFDSETKRCKHYEHRPKVCRDYMCEELEEWASEVTALAMGIAPDREVAD